MDRRYRDKGLVIIGFPCNQFRGQEPKKCNEIIKEVKDMYGAEFEIMNKIDVNGPGAHPIFIYLRKNTKELISVEDSDKVLQIPWNFCKWIVDRKGRVQMYLNPTI